MLVLPWLLLVTPAAIAAAYDYIIVGGGTSGLAVANRLSEDPAVSVLVIEAGPSVFDNVNVTDISRLPYTYDSPLDWAFETTQQAFGQRRQVMRAGKALGGTSVMNGAAYARAETIQIDALQEMGNKGWTWEALMPYYLKSENVSVPIEKQTRAGATLVPEYHGRDGPVHVGFMDMEKGENDLVSALNRTFASMGIPWNRDLNSGHMRGFTLHPYTVDPSNIRSDAARAYYWPYANRRNLHVKLNTFVTRIVWGRQMAGEGLLAEGVEVSSRDRARGRPVLRARREVILAAGALLSPVILERSGVGNPRILQDHGIPVRIDLPGVGENLQDQLNTSFVLSTTTHITGSRTVAFVSASDIFGSSTESVSASILADLPGYAETIANQNNGAMEKGTLQRLFESQYDHMFNKSIPVGEFVFILDNPNQIHVGYWGLLPFARGNVHISSLDPTAPPTVNPNYGLLNWDVLVQIGMSKFLRRMIRTGELQGLIDEEKLPGLTAVPHDASDETWKAWIGEQYTPNYHAVGTASMLPRSMGGVVDDRLRVYGTRNVRVVDASIQPVQLCGHPTANIYAIAEWVSDVIKADASRVRGRH